MDITIRQIDWRQALDYYLEVKAFRDHVTMTEKGAWFAAYCGGEDAAPCGIVSTQQIGRWTRIKTLHVREDCRRRGVATSLVRHVADGPCTAFAFDASREVFARAGFAYEHTGKNGVHFMRKSA